MEKSYATEYRATAAGQAHPALAGGPVQVAPTVPLLESLRRRSTPRTASSNGASQASLLLLRQAGR